MENDFYVYIYLDPRKKGVFRYGEYEFGFEPFYIGKGKIKYNEKGNITYNRWKKLDGRNDHFINKYNKIKRCGLEPIVVKIKENMIEDDSFLLEIELIDIIGRQKLGKGPLVNFTDGGEGASGCIHSKESIESTAEKLRMNFSDIRKEFERRRYTLLTEEKDYKNCDTKLEYIHLKCGNKHSISWDGFQQGQGCPICGTESTAEKQRKDFSDIRKEFERRRYTLLTEEKDYKNCDTKLEYIHLKCGNKHSISWTSFQQGSGCPICAIESCSEKLRKDFSDIKQKFERRRYTLLTEEKDYKNCDTKLEYIHLKCGNKHSISWDGFQQGQGCPICARNKIYFSDIKKEFEQRNYNLLSEEKDYKNSKDTKLEYICPRGHTGKISWGHFQQGRKCPKCNKENRIQKRKELKNDNRK